MALESNASYTSFKVTFCLCFRLWGSPLPPGFPLAAVRGAPLQGRWAGFSLRWPLLVLSEGSRARGLQQSQLPGSGALAQRLWGTASAAPCPEAPSSTRHRTLVSCAAGWFPYDGATRGARDVNFMSSVFPVSLSLKRGRKAAMGPSTHQSWNSSQDPAVPHCPLRAGQVLGPIPSAVRSSSVAQSCPPLCNPMDCGTPGLFPSATPGVYSNSCLSSR